MNWSYPFVHTPDGWSDARGAPDLSNTQYAVLGLHAATKRGVRVPAKTWRSLIPAILRYQASTTASEDEVGDGLLGFEYRPGGHSPSGSMTAAGIVSLKICSLQLDAGLGRRDAVKLEAAIQGGLAWLDHFWTFETTPNPGPNWWSRDHWFYYVYGLERAGREQHHADALWAQHPFVG